MNDLVINFTPTGMIPTRELSPHVPIEPAEIVEDILSASELGITMVHLHARDPISESPTWKKEVYAEIISDIRKYAPDLILCVSLSGRDFPEYERRSSPLFLEGDLKPDMGSLTLSSLNFNKIVSINTPETIIKLAKTMLEKKIKPELEAFDTGMLNYAKYLIRKKILVPPYYCNILLGNIACAQADLLHAGMMVRDLPTDTIWSFAGIGDNQLPINSVAIAMGGGVRIGLEDNIWFDKKRKKLASNYELLKRIHSLASANERKIMTPKKLRRLLNLESGHGKYGTKT